MAVSGSELLASFKVMCSSRLLLSDVRERPKDSWNVAYGLAVSSSSQPGDQVLELSYRIAFPLQDRDQGVVQEATRGAALVAIREVVHVVALNEDPHVASAAHLDASVGHGPRHHAEPLASDLLQRRELQQHLCMAFRLLELAQLHQAHLPMVECLQLLAWLQCRQALVLQQHPTPWLACLQHCLLPLLQIRSWLTNR